MGLFIADPGSIAHTPSCGPYHTPAQGAQSSPWVCPLKLEFQHLAPACTSRRASWAEECSEVAWTLCAGLSLFCLLQTGCCILLRASEAPFLSWLNSPLVKGLPRDLKPLYANRCHYVPKTSQKEAEEVNCPHLSRGFCTPRIRGNTCFCCDLYNCGNRVEITGGYYEYIDVSSCQDIIHLYHLLWSATILNIVGLFLGIITAAVLGGFKDMNPTLPALNCSVENAHPTVSYYARPQVTSYNTYYHSPPHLPPYSAYDFQHSSVFPSSPPSGLSDEPQSASPSPSYMWSSSAPPRYSPPYYPPFEKPPPYSP
ncbi:transmembrane protein 255A isoform X5 [Camelus ferus]|uniref:Transmembrane protein 255A n=2 Tax=Camelus TaxID=9836 RepID=A0A8B8SJ38_CAMFR|nr:transmembrane protein 255A isoform X5 [Camelus dromedarius]XP_032330253.1 transmembrane protein 255A isoform X5 [Camelus ferus]XP_045379259.1 transmembrane protein 255A isoform X5 [Camelus bactrianus]